MLEYLRNAAEKPLAKFLIAILAFSFIGWGVAEWIFGGGISNTDLVRVGDTEISVNQFNNHKSQVLARMSRDQQRMIYTDPNAARAFNNQIISELTSKQMVQNRASDLGFVISDHRVAQQIREFPEFQKDGKFSPERFNAVLNANGLSEDSLAAMLRADTARYMVLGSMGERVNVPNFVVDAVYNKRYATRDIEYKTVKFDTFGVKQPTDDVLKTYYEQHPKMLPETRHVSYVFVSAEMTKPDSYDEGSARMQKVEDEIIAGETLETAAKKHGAKFVQLRDVAQAGTTNDANITPEIIAKIFAMDEGADSETIELKNGFAILHLDKVNPAHKAEFANIKKELVPEWISAEKRKAAYEKANAILVDLNKENAWAGATAKTVTRTEGAPVMVLNDAFNNTVGTNKIVEAPDAFYVLSIKADKQPGLDTAKKAKLRAELEGLMMYQIQADYNNFLHRKYPVKMNTKVYNRFIEK